MGCDGGTIPKRCELVNEKKKEEKKDRNAELRARWNNCAISQQPLVKPIVCCELGRLYNKECVIEFLLNKSKADHAGSFSHLRGLKDVRELNLSENPSFTDRGAEKVDPSELRRDAIAPYVCPIVGIEMNGKYRFVCIWSCGCVFSERALKEVKGSQCHKCGKPYTAEDVITINGSAEEAELLAKRMEERRQKAKLEKKPKQRCAAAPAAAGGDTSQLTDARASSESTTAGKRSHNSDEAIQEQPVEEKASQQPKQLNSDGPGGKKARLATAAAAAAVRPTSSSVPAASSSKATSKCKSLQTDSKRSDAFKSLFTTHKTAIDQPKSHWVTFNPQYF